MDTTKLGNVLRGHADRTWHGARALSQASLSEITRLSGGATSGTVSIKGEQIPWTLDTTKKTIVFAFPADEDDEE